MSSLHEGKSRRLRQVRLPPTIMRFSRALPSDVKCHNINKNEIRLEDKTFAD